MKKAKLLKLADFIEKLKPKALDMDCVVDKFDSDRCATIACAMGWTPKVFPREMKWLTYSAGVMHIETGAMNWTAMATLFDISCSDANVIFSDGGDRYYTPKQVAAGIREYVKLGRVPSRMLSKKEY